MANFENSKFFKSIEFDSPDALGSGKKMQESHLQKLEIARYLASIPFIITSGFRTPGHNRKVGGKKDSSHLSGYASDIKATSSSHRYIIINALIEAGFHRIGIGKGFIHADNDPTKPPSVVWLY